MLDIDAYNHFVIKQKNKIKSIYFRFFLQIMLFRQLYNFTLSELYYESRSKLYKKDES